jgi:glycosyltransferase involved in cell wall biosynthesis
VIYGALEQRTGGYIYDRSIVARLRARGQVVGVVSVEPGSDPGDLARTVSATESDVVVGDALAASEIGLARSRWPGRTPLVLLVHHLTIWEDESQGRATVCAAESRAIASSDHLVATSAWTAGRLIAEYRRAVDVVVPGADRLPRLPRPPLDDARVVLTFVGSIVPRKRLSWLIDAMDRVAAPNLELRVVGDPLRDAEHAAAIADRIASSPYLRTHVVALGPIEDRAVAEELARADALVLPSSLEGYGIVLTEALHAGVPVIAARTGAIPEVVGGGDSAMLFDDISELGDAITRFASTPALRHRMRLAAQRRADHLPTWDGASQDFSAVLTRTAGRSAVGESSSARAR